MTNTTELALSEEMVRERSRLAGEPEWLLQRRLEAWRAYDAMEMPTPLEEEWRRTDITGLDLEAAAASLSVRPGRADIPAGLSDAAGLDALLVGQDGVIESVHRSEGLASGVVFSDLATAASEHPDLLRELLGTVVSPTEWKLQALAGALWRGGVFVHVPAGVEVALPLRFLNVATPGSAGMGHILVLAEEGSSVTLIQDSYSPEGDSQTLISGAVEIICRPQARVRFFDIERWNRGTYSFNTIRARLERGAEVTVSSIGFGGRLTRSRVEAFLEGESSRADLVGVSFGDGEQHFDYQTLQDHIAPRTSSDLLYKAALTERASEVWYGTVRIRKGASGSDANQTSRNLLLSSRAKAAPIPVLEIEQYDILRCSHGATAGPLDEEQLFYLESRGVDHEESERMLVSAFFHEVLDRIPSEAIRTSVEEALTAKLAANRAKS